MSTPVAYGIDFGTTNSVLSVLWDDGAVEVVDGADGPLLRSVAFLSREGTRLAGRSAIEAFLRRPDTDRARLFVELKAALTSESLDRLDVFGGTQSIESLVGLVFAHLKQRADAYTGHDVRNAVVGFPVAFPAAEGSRFDELQDLALDRLCRAANAAGFDAIVPLEEPAAACSNEDAELYATLDFGGGTFDVAVIRNGEFADILALTGTHVGGELLTALLFRAVLSPHFGLDHPKMPNRHLHSTTSLGQVLTALFRRDLPLGVLREYAPDYADLIERGFLFDLYEAVDAAKIALSTEQETSVALDRRGVSLSVPVGRSTFERVIADPLDRVMAEVDRAVARAGIDGDDLELISLTGGSSRIPVFQSAVAERFPNARIEAREPYSLVARGLAEQAKGLQW